MSQLSLNNLDKSNWQKLPFGEIAQSISERVEPTTTNLETYVGLEHIDPESIHIKRFGKREDVSGTKLRCYPDDVIFGRRRAYQRKAAICEFDGFCSAHSLVLRAIPEVIDPKLFPFFLHSDQFMHRAVDISVGGLSPTINWTKLKQEEFLLPPKDQQAKLAELLWAADKVLISSREKYQSLDRSFKSYAKEIASKDHPFSEYRSIKDLCHIKDNLRQPLNSSERASIKGSIPYYGANGVVDHINNFIFDEPLCLLAEDGGNFSEFHFKEIAYRVYGKAWVNNHAHVLTVKNESIPFEWLFYSLVHKNLLKWIIGTTRVKLNKAELLRVPIWVPQADVMNKYITRIQCIETAREASKVDLKSSAQLLKSLINEIFSQHA